MKNLLEYNPELNFWEVPQDNLDITITSTGLENFDKTTDDFIPAIPTLYNTDWSIDYEELENILETHSNAWVSWALIAWTTWESSFLNDQEHIDYISEAVKIANQYNMRIYAWTWSNCTQEQNHLTQNAFKSWAHASLLLPPYYIKCSNNDLIRHLNSWLDYWPGIIYSVASRTSMPIPIKVLEVLSRHPNFLWVKECDWSDRIQELSRLWIRVWTGNDDESFLNIHRDGAKWVISVVWNINPTLMQEVVEGVSMTKEKIDELLCLSHIAFLPWQPNPKGIHNIMEMTRRAQRVIWAPAVFRWPSWPLSLEQQEYVAGHLARYWIDAVPFGDNYRVL